MSTRRTVLARLGLVLTTIGLAAAVLALWSWLGESRVPALEPARGAPRALQKRDGLERAEAPHELAREELAEPIAPRDLVIEAETELNAAEREALLAKLGPGTLEVLVYVGREPARGARVQVWSDEQNDELHPLSAPAGSLAAATDADGLARFESLPWPNAWIRAEVSPSLAGTQFRDVAERALFAFGAASVEGRVYHEDGSPWSGTPVVALVTPAGARVAETNERGEYCIDGLSQGSCALLQRPQAELAELEDRRAQVELRAGETSRADFGSPKGSAHWRGVLRFEGGARFAHPFELEFAPVPQGWVVRARTVIGGGASAELEWGKYEVRLAGFGGAKLALGTLAIDRREVEQDFTVPGARIGGRVLVEPAGKDARAIALRTTPKLEGGPTAEPFLLRWQDRYAFLGLEPGRYVITWPDDRMLRVYAGRMPVEVMTAGAHVELDVTVASY